MTSQTIEETEAEVAEMAFTGERFMPEVAGQIAFEHLHRYHYAARFCAGKQVLDVACGEGYGSQILSKVAASVTGVDIAAETVEHARARYGSDHLRFVEASAALLPLDDASVDVVVSFETIEHHDQHEEMLSEIRRVLRPGGLLVLSSPNKQYYTIEPGYSNPYHVKELFRDELVALVGRYFQHHAVYSQRVVYGSLLIADGNARFESILGTGPDTSESEAGLSRPLYDLIVASNGALPALDSSFFELKVHGLDSATFYGVHLPERVQGADHRVLELEHELGQQAALHEAAIEQRDSAELEALRQANAVQALELEQVRQANAAQAVELEQVRSNRDEVLSSLVVLGSLVDEVRRERGEQRSAQERGLDALQVSFELTRQQLADASISQTSGLGAFKEQLLEVRKQLDEAVGREERIRSLEQLLAESQSMVLAHLNEAGAHREEMARLEREREEARREVQALQIAVTEQRLIGEHRERDVEALKQSRSWRYTGWLRKLSGSARRHL